MTSPTTTAAADYRNFSEIRIGQKFTIADAAGVVYAKCRPDAARALHNGKVYQIRAGKLCVAQA